MNATKRISLIALLVAAGQISPLAQADDGYKARYEADRKLCAEESSSGARMQCLRDAKAEYDKALAASGTASKTAARSATTTCKDCGKVLSVSGGEKKGEGGPFTSLQDFCLRVDAKALNKRTIDSLVKAGAFDFLQKPVDPEQLVLLLRRAVEHQQLVAEVR